MQFDRDMLIKISGASPEKCMKCGKCSASCPSFHKMEYHPHQFADMIISGDIEPLLKSQASFLCLSCFACSDRCPRGVEPQRLIEAVRLAALRQKGVNHMKKELLDNVFSEDLPQQALTSAFRKYSK